MAYLNFREAELSGSLVSAFVPRDELEPRVQTATGLSALEWLVVALAERDHISSLRKPGRIARALVALFGEFGKRPLANPQLEAVRRLAVHAWHRGYAVPASELTAFRLAGFSADQAETLLESVVGRRAARRNRRFA